MNCFEPNHNRNLQMRSNAKGILFENLLPYWPKVHSPAMLRATIAQGSMKTDLPASLHQYQDILDRINFDAKNGRIWLAERRMLLLQSASMELLRKELIQTLGFERTKGIIMRLGFAEGFVEAQWARTLRKDHSEQEAFRLGPQLHKVKGCVEVKVESEEIELGADRFRFAHLWENSYEAENYLTEWGPAREPVCWHLLGYATGYSTAFAGRKILIEETHCVARGDKTCRIVAKPEEEWEDSDRLMKYFKPDHIADQLFELQSQVDHLRSRINESNDFEDLIGRSQGFKQACKLVEKAAPTTVTLLLLGETGVGKEVFARAAHRSSPRANKPFISVNCGAIPGNLIEAELFGVAKGAYTGAHQAREGRFERAQGGTLFLDEIGELSLAAQAALLRVLQEGELERVGGQETRSVDVRVVAATNRPLEDMVKSGQFREDLYYRISSYPVIIPPLRKRTEDIPLLAKHFLSRYASLFDKPIKGLSQKALAALSDHAWPGNVRELQNLLERGVILADSGGLIQAEHLFGPDANLLAASPTAEGHLSGPQSQQVSQMANRMLDQGLDLSQLETELIRQALDKADQNVSKAARLLNISRATLDYRLKKLQL